MILNDDELHYAHTFDELRSIIYNSKDNDRWTTNHVLDLLDIESMLADKEEQLQDDIKLFYKAITSIIDYLLCKLDYDNVNIADINEISRGEYEKNLKYIEDLTISKLFYELLEHITTDIYSYNK